MCCEGCAQALCRAQILDTFWGGVPKNSQSFSTPNRSRESLMHVCSVGAALKIKSIKPCLLKSGEAGSKSIRVRLYFPNLLGYLSRCSVLVNMTQDVYMRRGP